MVEIRLNHTQQKDKEHFNTFNMERPPQTYMLNEIENK